MASDAVRKYTIQMEIEQGDKTRANLDEIERSIKAIGESAKNGISDGLADASKKANDLVASVKAIAQAEGDSTKEIEAFNRASAKATTDLEKQATAIQYALSDAGKKQRERIALLKKELENTTNDAKGKAQKKRIEAEIKQLEKGIVSGTDEELKLALKNNKELRARLKLAREDLKIMQAQKRESKTLASLVKDDLKSIKEKIKQQTKFIQALKTTEGRYKAIKKAAGGIGKGAGMAAAGLAGGALALGGMAIASAQSQVDREREATRIKAAMTDDEKQALLGEMYIKTGADYTTIVDAINRVTSVLGIHDKEGIASAAVSEIRYPGAAAMFRQQNTGKVTAQDFGTYAGRMKAIQSATGASIEQVRASTEKIANLRQGNFSNASMTDLQSIYLTLQNSGAYDTQEELDRAYSAFLRAQRGQKGDVFEFAKNYFSEKTTQSRGVWGATNRQQAAQAFSAIDWGRVREAGGTTGQIGESAAERTAQKMRMLEEKKNQVLIKVLEAIAPVLDAIPVDELSKFFEGMIELVKVLAPALKEIMEVLIPAITKLVTFLTDTLGKLIDFVTQIFNALKNSRLGKWMSGEISGEDLDAAVSGQPRSNGGIATMPSIAGERGPEMVVPLDYSRMARGAQLTQYLTQHFTMAGSETTALSLSQAVKSRDFSRAMASNAYLASRMGR